VLGPGPARLHLREWGDPAAPTIVCIHGVTAHGRRFAPLVEAGLVERFHVVAPDLRGHGHSTWEPPWSLEQHLDDLLASVPEDARYWVGHSFGGRLLLELACRRPDRVERGVLLDPAVWVPPGEALKRAELLRAETPYESVAAALDARPDAATFTAEVRAIVEADLAEHLAAGDDGLLRLRFCRSAAIAAYGEMARTPPGATLDVPLVLVRATKSDVCPPRLIEMYAERVGPHLSSVEVTGQHTLMWDAADETARAIESFLR
jgi:lipase